MIPYLIHTSILLALSYFFYWIFLRKETFYSLNRWFLIGAFVGSLLIPLIPIPTSMSFNVIAIDQPVSRLVKESPIVPLQTPNLGEEVKAIPLPPTPPKTDLAPIEKEYSFIDAMANWNFSKILWVMYLLGTVVFLLNFIIQFVILLMKKRNLETIKDGKFTIYELEDDSSPFSFFHWIFINPRLYEPETFDQILHHEKIHVSQSHYIDKLIAELAVILFWFSPFSWLYRKAITNNLEFLTDSEILENGTERESYQMSLLQVSVPQHPLTLTTNYNESFLAQRIRMMNERKSSAKSSWKYLLTIPMILLTMASLNAVQIPETLTAEAQIERVDTPVTPAPNTAAEIEKDKKKNKSNKKNERVEIEYENEHVNIIEVDGMKISDIVSNAVNNALENVDINLEGSINGKDFKTDENGAIRWNHGNVKPGHWEAQIQGNKVCFYWNNQYKNKSYWSTSECILKSTLSPLPMNGEGEFSLVRDAGTMLMKGEFRENNGSGSFEITTNPEYASFIKSLGLRNPGKHELMNLFFNNMSKNYITELVNSDYKLDLDEIIELGVHNVTLSDLEDYTTIFEKLDVSKPSQNKIVEMAIHGVDLDFVNELKKMDIQDLTINKVIEAKIHGVDSDYMNEMKEAGYGDISINRLIEFAIHGVSTDDLAMYNELGYGDVSPNKIVEFAIHGVDADFVKGFDEIGYTDLPSHKLVEFAIHGVTPRFVKEMKDQGYDDISPSKLVECRIHGVNGDYIGEMQDLGLNDVGLSKYVEFAIHGVSEDYLSALKKEGYDDLSPQNLVEGRIHGVSASYIRDLKELNVKDLTFRRLVEGRIHGVDRSFIKKARSKGYNPSSLSEYINLRIHGL